MFKDFSSERLWELLREADKQIEMIKTTRRLILREIQSRIK